MRQYLKNTLTVLLLIFLGGCYQSSPVTQMFNPFPPSQASLTQSVQEALLLSDDPVIANVRADANQNTVILTGYVKKIRQSDTAEQIARQVPGVQNVDNRLIVRQ